MKIAIGADHGGYKLKEEIKKYLDEKEIEYKDFGTDSELRVDYPLIAKDVCKSIQNKECDFGILICRTGYGMAMVANKFKGIRCAPCYNEETTKFARMHNNINILALGADQITTNEAISPHIISSSYITSCFLFLFLKSYYMISEIEKENMK